MFEGLNIALNASDTISGKLRDVSGEAADVGQQFAKTAGSSLNLAQSIDISEDEIKQMQKSLKRVPPTAQVSSESLGHLQNVAENLGDESQELTANVELLDSAFGGLPDHVIESSLLLGRLDETIENTTQSTYSLATGTHILSEGLDEGGHSAAKMAAETAMLERELEDVRNDALQAAGAVETFDLATDKFDFGGVGINVGPITGGIRQVATVIAAVLPLVLALGTAFVGVATAAVLLGGAIAALFAGGVVGRAEDMAAASEDIEGTMEAVQEIMSQVAEAMSWATAPLQSAEMQNFAMSGLEGFVRWVRMASEALASMSDIIIPLAERIGGAFLDETPEFFAAMEDMLRTLGPMIADILVGLLRDVPDFIRFLTEETHQLLPALSSFMDALVGLLVPITRIGTVIMSVLLPPLSLLMDTVSALITPIVNILSPAVEFLADVMNFLANELSPVLQLFAYMIGTITALGAAVFTVTNGLTLIATVMSGILSVGSAVASFLAGGLTASLYSVAVAAWSALGPVGILLGALAGIAGYMGLFDGIISQIPGMDGDDVNVNHEDENDAPPTRNNAGGMNTDNSTNVEIGQIDASAEGTTEARIRRIVRQEVKNAGKSERTRETGRPG